MDKISDEVRSYIAKMDKIHEQGTLTRVVLSELKRLDILYPQEPNYSTYEDSTKLAQLMYEFVTREPGVDVSPNYIGAYIRMAIVTVARPEKILLGKTTPHFEFIKAMLSKGVDHFYIVSAGPLIGYAKDLINDTQQKLQLRKVYEEEYEGKFRGKMTKMFCALLVSAS
jgi:hypothetical protein